MKTLLCLVLALAGCGAGGSLDEEEDELPPPAAELDPCAVHETTAECCAAECMWLENDPADGPRLGCISRDIPTCDENQPCPDGQPCDIRSYPCRTPDSCAAGCSASDTDVGFCQ